MAASLSERWEVGTSIEQHAPAFQSHYFFPSQPTTRRRTAVRTARVGEGERERASLLAPREHLTDRGHAAQQPHRPAGTERAKQAQRALDARRIAAAAAELASKRAVRDEVSRDGRADHNRVVDLARRVEEAVAPLLALGEQRVIVTRSC